MVAWRLSSTRRQFFGRCQRRYTNKVHGKGLYVIDNGRVLFNGRPHPRWLRNDMFGIVMIYIGQIFNSMKKQTEQCKPEEGMRCLTNSLRITYR